MRVIKFTPKCDKPTPPPTRVDRRIDATVQIAAILRCLDLEDQKLVLDLSRKSLKAHAKSA